MVHKQIELHPNAPIYSNDDEPTMTRRSFNKKVGAATLVGVGVGGVAGVTKMLMDRKSDIRTAENAGGQDEAITQAVSIVESQASIEALTQNPDLFAKGCGSDPISLVGAEYEQLVDMGGVLVTPANKNNTLLFAKDALGTVELIIRAGGTKQDLLNDIAEGHEIGVRSETGTLVGPMTEGYENYADRTNREYGEPMLTGIGPDYFNGANTTPVKEIILKQQHFNAGQFESHAVRQRAIGVGDATLDYTTSLLFKNVEELPIYESGFRGLEQLKDPKRVKIDFQTRRGTPEDFKDTDSTTTLVYSKDGETDKYLVLFENYYPDKTRTS